MKNRHTNQVIDSILIFVIGELCQTDTNLNDYLVTENSLKFSSVKSVQPYKFRS